MNDKDYKAPSPDQAHGSSRQTPADFDRVFAAVLRMERRRALIPASAVWGSTLLASLAIYALLDVSTPLENETRQIVSGVLALALSVLLALLLVRAWRVSPHSVACRADENRHDSRRTIQTSREIGADVPPASPMGAWLAAATERTARAGLLEYMGTVRWRHLFRRWSVRILIIMAVLMAGAVLWQPQGASVICARLVTPWKDVPPLSPYRFELVDSPSSVIYGDDALMQVRVTGAPLAAPLEIWVRFPGHDIQKLPAFRDQDGRWARRLEKLTSPCQIAFATADSRARSAWFPLEINYQPKVTGGGVVITPPDYINLGEKEYTLNGQDVTAIEGGRVQFILESNRALMSGRAVFTPDRKELPPSEAEGTLLPDGRMSFSFQVRQSGQVSIQIADYRGTGMERPLENKIRVQADARPSVAILKPPPVSVVMEDSVLPFHVEIQDDYGLVHAAWLRGVNNARTRALEIPVPSSGKRSLLLAEQVALPAIGARAGDVLQFSAEARDTNPYLLNMTVAEPVTVHVISEEQYRELVRIKTQMDDFINRYRLLTEGIRELVVALDREMASGTDSLPAQTLADLKEKHGQLRQIAERIAADFPAFDTDGRLAVTAGAIAAVIRDNERDLAGSQPSGRENVRQFLQTLRDRMEAPRQELEGQHREAEQIAAVMKGYELVMELRRLAAAQKEVEVSLARYLEEQRLGRPVTKDQLLAIGESQKAVLKQYKAWNDKFPDVLKGIPSEAKEFAEELRQLRETCGKAGIESLMEGSSSACGAGNDRKALADAEAAHQAIMNILGQDPAAQQCQRGQACPVDGMCDEAANTMKQMLDALLCRNQCKKPGFGIGGEGGGYGSGGDNFSMMEAPMFGPKRSSFADPSPSRRGSGRGERKTDKTGGQANANGDSAQGGGKDGSPNSAEQAGRQSGPGAPAMQQVPPRYRDAVKRYFEQRK